MWQLDSRSIAVVRIGLGLLLVITGIEKLIWSTAFYSDSGVFSRLLASKYTPAALQLSWLSMTGSEWIVAAVVGLSIALGVSALLGYRSNLCFALCWAILSALNLRNPQIVTGFDEHAPRLLLLAVFLPVDVHWALRPSSPNRSWSDAAGACFILQVFLSYCFSGILKTGPEWGWEGSAIEYALRVAPISSALGESLLAFPGLLKSATYLVRLSELVLPYFLLLPNRLSNLRLAAASAFFSMHIGIWVLMRLGWFAPLCMISLLIFIPGGLWDRLGEKWKVIPSAWQMPSSARNGGSYFFAMLGTFLLYSNLETLPGWRWPMPGWLQRAGELTQLKQNWATFAPSPLRWSGRFEILAQTGSGASIHLLNADGGARSVSVLWTFYLSSLVGPGAEDLRVKISSYACRSSAEPIRSVDLLFFRSQNRAGHPPDPETKEVLYSGPCPESEASSTTDIHPM